MNLRPAAFVAAALASLFVAAPALADKKEGRPAVERHVKDDKPAGSECPDRVFSTVFAAFTDRALYTLAPDGAFEAGAAGWELGAGAAVVDESSSILLGPALGARSLELAGGASVTSPAICVARGFPSFRFATRGEGVVRVEILYGDGRKSKRAGWIRARAAWRVTRRVSLAQGRFRVARGEVADVQLRFTAFRGTVRMDDVYVDPRLRR